MNILNVDNKNKSILIITTLNFKTIEKFKIINIFKNRSFQFLNLNFFFKLHPGYFEYYYE